MGKHRSNETSTSHTSKNPDFRGRHDARTDDKTVEVRVDTDGTGRMTGFSAGREYGPDNYGR